MKKKKLTAVITGGKDQFGVSINDVPYLHGAGDTVEEAKNSLLESIKLMGYDVPEALKGEYELNFMFDISGLLKYYSKFVSFAAMESLTGIHQKQLSNYANGYRNPSKKTTEKILNGLRSFGEELSQVKIAF